MTEPVYCVDGCSLCLPRRKLRVLVCGGRTWGKLPMRADGRVMLDHPDFPKKFAERQAVNRELDKLAEVDAAHPLGKVELTVVHGGAEGADDCGDEWAVLNWANIDSYRISKADWDRLGHAAGPIRNQTMLEKGKPDLVLAFPGNRGTSDMTTRALKAGVKVIFWQPEKAEERA